MNICMVGYGMMGTWHSDALQDADCVLHTLVGRRPEPSREFASRYGYRNWTTDYEEALQDEDIDIVILANPSEMHARTAQQALAHGKHTLVEIPIAMNLSDAEDVVATAQEQGRILGVVHPLRMRREMRALRERAENGKEQVHQICGRFYINRLKNVGGTGYHRSWTDNLLWHHTTHLLDFGLWMLGMLRIQRIHNFMPSPSPKTGIPMEVALVVETDADQSIVCSGSYHGDERIFETLVVTDQDSYRLDIFRDALITKNGLEAVAAEAQVCGDVTRDFLDAVQEQRPPAITGASVLPTMQVLQTAQDQWDAVHGRRSIPGRALKR